MPQDNTVPSIRITKVDLDYYVCIYEKGRRTQAGPYTSLHIARTIAVDAALRLGIVPGGSDG